MGYEYVFDPDKNRQLIEERGISFEEIILLIELGRLVDVVEHSNKKKYPNQRFYAIDVDGYIYLVPFVRDGDKIYIKTIYPSRKATKKYIRNRGGT